MEISVKNLMSLERILLEMSARMRFDLEFSEAYELLGYLSEIGAITDYVFHIQEEYAKEYNDKELSKKYNEKIMSSSVNLDYEKITSFIDNVIRSYDNDEFSKIVGNLKFW